MQSANSDVNIPLQSQRGAIWPEALSERLEAAKGSRAIHSVDCSARPVLSTPNYLGRAQRLARMASGELRLLVRRTICIRRRPRNRLFDGLIATGRGAERPSRCLCGSAAVGVSGGDWLSALCGLPTPPMGG
jgi:hypothetical protein